MEEEVPGNGGWAKDGKAEESARVAGKYATGRKGTRRSEKAKVSEEALLTRSSEANKPMNACGHTYTKSQTPSTRRRGPGWRIHESVEDTKLSTNKQHTLSKIDSEARAIMWPVDGESCQCGCASRSDDSSGGDSDSESAERLRRLEKRPNQRAPPPSPPTRGCSHCRCCNVFIM